MPRAAISIVAFVLLAGALAVGLAVPTGATPVDEPTAGVGIAPHSGPNGEFVAVSDGEIELQFDRVNDRANSEFDDVFTITTDESRSAWIEAEVDGVTFYADGDPTDEINDSNPVELAAGETVSVGVSIDTHVATGGTETFTVVAVAGDGDAVGDPDIHHVDTTVSPTELPVGDAVTVTQTYENRGDGDGSTTAELVVDGLVVDTERVVVGAGGTRTVTFERTVDEVGKVKIGSTGATQTVIVRPSGEPAPAFEVRDVGLESARIEPGEPVRAEATVGNVGNATGETDVEFAVGTVVVETERIELDPGEETRVAFERRLDDPGTYEVAVDGDPAGSVTVGDRSAVPTGVRELPPSAGAAVLPPAAVGVFLLLGVTRRRA
ncbi:CARDB domain-containing protein [Salinilacihabitans rarus]|uniref:CARDB domain-containing protein n=1 Tax=Salinilacihabitans rarus TaxID=2961596 RepID=UPI0020C916C2|nr:CARDB domain-containing protein [Salinilacihabitans rarus]